jgi:hypothetical protein
MTNCERVICDYVEERSADIAAPIDEAKLLRGIESYAESAGLNALDLNGGESRMFFDLYLKPFDKMSGEFLLSYFYNYAKLAEFITASNEIFQAAKRRVTGGETPASADYIPAYERLQALAAELHPMPEFRERVRREVSECALDVAAIEGRGAERSFRLGGLLGPARGVDS